MNQPLNLIELPEIQKPFRSPSLQECGLYADFIGMAQLEAEKFFHFYESNGWKVGRNKMKSWHSAMAGWKCRVLIQSAPASMSGMDKLIAQKEFERVLEKIRVIQSTYGDHQTKTDQDRATLQKLLARKKELMEKLGVMI